jgi:hypothetical protein
MMKTIIALFAFTAFTHTFVQPEVVAESSATVSFNKNLAEMSHSTDANELVS